MQKIGLLFLLFMLIGWTSSQAADAVSTPPTEKPTPTIPYAIDTKREIRQAAPVRIKKTVDANALLSESGEIYSLTGLDIPDDNDTAPKTQKRLSELTEGKKCTLYQTRSDKVGRINRMNQIIGQFTCGQNETWIQGVLLSEGLARVRTTPDNKTQSAAMLALEQKARDRKIGLWALPMNAVFTPVTAAQHVNSFGIVEGTVYATSQNRNAIFLNFTADWKTDFSIGIPATLRKDFARLRIDPMALKGKTIRVRGWLRNYNGPYIELDHAEQLEIIADKPAAASIVEKIIESTLPQNTPSSAGENKQFMHTIGGKKTQDIILPEPPPIEEPKLPEIPKPVAPSVQRPLNR